MQPGHHPSGTLLDDPAAQLRKAIEQSVEDEDTQEDLWRVMDRDEVLRLDVLTASEVVLHGHVVVVEDRVQQLPAAANMQDKGRVRLAEDVPERIQVGMRRGSLSRRRRRDHDGLAAE